MILRINPLAPTKQPATTSTVLVITKPAAAAPSPENEFNKAITTGISPPPIGITPNTPISNDSPMTHHNQKKVILSISLINLGIRSFGTKTLWQLPPSEMKII